MKSLSGKLGGGIGRALLSFLLVPVSLAQEIKEYPVISELKEIVEDIKKDPDRISNSSYFKGYTFGEKSTIIQYSDFSSYSEKPDSIIGEGDRLIMVYSDDKDTYYFVEYSLNGFVPDEYMEDEIFFSRKQKKEKKGKMETADRIFREKIKELQSEIKKRQLLKRQSNIPLHGNTFPKYRSGGAYRPR